MHIGILGAGQLGRMLALAGANLGLRTRLYDPSPDACGGHVAELHVGEFTDLDRLDRFAAGLDLITYEFENVPVHAVRHLARRVTVHPNPEALRIGQDRLEERALFRRLNLPIPEFAPVASRAELDSALSLTGLPAVLKTRRGGYDGKGQAVLRAHSDLDHAFTQLGSGSIPLILEAFIPFTRELSILACRARDGTIALYPLTQNEHRLGILRQSLAPAPNLSPALQLQADHIARSLLEALDYVGLLAVELFDLNGTLLINELAPRVHNSGHWTLNGSSTSQFENHLRAVAGLPLGPADALGHAAMLNLIGDAPPLAALAALPGAHVHLYAKSPRPGRKIGHLNFTSPTPAPLLANLALARATIEPSTT